MMDRQSHGFSESRWMQVVSEGLVVMSALRCSEEHVSRIEAALSRCQCIIEGCRGNIKTRGLCLPHYNEFTGLMRSKGVRERAKFEKENIEDGNILAPYQQRSMTRKSVFVRS